VTEVGLVVTTFNRPGYLARMLESLRRSELTAVSLAIVDDGSTRARTRRLVEDFDVPGVEVSRIFRSRKPRNPLLHVPVIRRRLFKNRHFTVHEALREGWDHLLRIHPGVRALVNLDADVLVHPCWLPRLRELFERERSRRGPLILTGFDAPRHAVIEEHRDFVRKETVGGINLMFCPELYRELVRPSLELYWDDSLSRASRARGVPLLCCRPSVIQHIGARGQFSRPDTYDRARSFEG
jgi:glycosyltransferase involved in cell wall biosynthesis